MLLFSNAHVQHDLPFAYAKLGIETRSGRSRKPDHDAVNEVNARVFDGIENYIAAHYDPSFSLIDMPFVPAEEVGTLELVKSWREQAWRSAERLLAADSRESEPRSRPDPRDLDPLGRADLLRRHARLPCHPGRYCAGPPLIATGRGTSSVRTEGAPSSRSEAALASAPLRFRHGGQRLSRRLRRARPGRGLRPRRLRGRAGLGGACDLAIVFAAAPHLGHAKPILSTVHERLEPRSLIGCGAGGVLGAGRELESGPGAVGLGDVGAPEARIATHHLEAEPASTGVAVSGLPAARARSATCSSCSPIRTRSAPRRCSSSLNSERPGMPVLGGLASAAAAGSAALFLDGEVLDGGRGRRQPRAASRCSPASPRGRPRSGPEMTITAAEGNVIAELASKPAIERLREAIAELDPAEQTLAAQGLMLGIVIDENQPAYERGDFLVRPILGADPAAGQLALGERVRVGQTVRMHVRDGATADEDLRDGAAGPGAGARRRGRGRGAAVHLQRPRLAHVRRPRPRRAGASRTRSERRPAGFFCAGEIGPVGGRNFLHGFTATIAVFPRAG